MLARVIYLAKDVSQKTSLFILAQVELVPLPVLKGFPGLLYRFAPSEIAVLQAHPQLLIDTLVGANSAA